MNDASPFTPRLTSRGASHAVASPVLALAVGVAAGCSSHPRYDLVLAGGRVMDPATGLDAIRNVGISGGKSAAISAQRLTGTSVVGVSGQVVAPGFIDLPIYAELARPNRHRFVDKASGRRSLLSPRLAGTTRRTAIASRCRPRISDSGPTLPAPPDDRRVAAPSAQRPPSGVRRRGRAARRAALRRLGVAAPQVNWFLWRSFLPCPLPIPPSPRLPLRWAYASRCSTSATWPAFTARIWPR